MLLKIFILLLVLKFAPQSAEAAHCTRVASPKTFRKMRDTPGTASLHGLDIPRAQRDPVLGFLRQLHLPTGWVAFGINPTSLEMTGTRILVIFPDPNSGHLLLLPYILDPSVKLQKSPPLSQPLEIHLVSSSATLYGGKMATIHNGAVVEIYATVKLAGNKTRVNFVWNRGLYVQGYSPTIPPTTVNDLSSVETIDVLSGISNSGSNYITTLKTIHGLLNAISWSFLVPVGAVLARYLRLYAP